MELTQTTSDRDPVVTANRYRLLEKLGEGGMAEVFRAEIRAMGGFRRIVALKLVKAHAAEEVDFNRLFLREAQIGGYLAHPNIVETLDFGLLNGRSFLAMEYVDGPSIEALLNRQRDLATPFPIDIVLSLMIQICHGLDYAHQATDHSGAPLEIVHRDMKPSNILVSRHGIAKIADFGVARAGRDLTSTPSASIVRGTLQYLSPEQAWGAPLDHRADLFSLGLILFEMLALEPCYMGRTMAALLKLALDAEVEGRLQTLPELPHRDELIRVLTRVLARDPEARYPSAGALAHDLEGILSSIPSHMQLAAWMRQAGFDAVEHPVTDELSGPTKYYFDFGLYGAFAPSDSGPRTERRHDFSGNHGPVNDEQVTAGGDTSVIATDGEVPAAADAGPGMLEPRQRSAVRSNRWAPDRRVVVLGVLALVIGYSASWLTGGAPGRTRNATVIAALPPSPLAAVQAELVPLNDRSTQQSAGSEERSHESSGSIPPRDIGVAPLPGNSLSGSSAQPLNVTEPTERTTAKAAAAGVRPSPPPRRASTGSRSLSGVALRERMVTRSDEVRGGTLALNSFPQSVVLVDGRKLDRFPVLNQPVSSGEHTLIFRVAQGRELSTRVVLKPGETVRCTAYFEENKVRCRGG